MKKELVKILEEGIEKIDPDLLRISEKLQIFFDEIVLFNPALKLVAASEEEIVRRHILDCLAPVNIIKAQIGDRKCNFADLGSGSGLPGLVLALALDNCHFTLVDRMERRIGFLRNTVARLGLSETVEILQKDLEQLNATYDCVTFRAFRQMEDIALYLGKITERGGIVFSYKSSEDNISQETDSLKRLIPGVFDVDTVGYSVPLLEARRSLLILKHN